MTRRYWEWDAVFTINPKKSALLIIDMQRGFLDPGTPLEVSMARKQIPVIEKLADYFHTHNLPVIYTVYEITNNLCYKFYWKMAEHRGLNLNCEKHPFSPGSGETKIINELKPKEKDLIIKKYGYDAFAGTNLSSILKSIGVTDLIITGTVVNWCVDSTVRSAYHQNYNVVVVADAVSGYDHAGISGEQWCRLELDLFAEAFGRVISADQIIYELGN